MSAGNDPDAIESVLSGFHNVSRVQRLSFLEPELQPIRSTDNLQCGGIVAEILRLPGEKRTPRFASINHSFGQGGIFILPPDSVATFKFSETDCTIAYLRPDRLAGFDMDAFGRLEIVPQLDPIDLQVTFLLACIREELEAGYPGGRRLMENLGLTLATHIFTRYASPTSSRCRFRGGLTARQVRRAQGTMLSALDQSVPLARLAQDAGLSPWYFCRAFKRSTGFSPHRWMRMKRLDQARALLADNHRSLTSIAIDLGYASLSHFSAAFKQATGYSPTRYRRGLES
jgi:AraC family transcriptional regulator